jgi:hypothetical protein
MNYPPEGLNVSIKNPNDNSWELAYFFENKWWRGVANNPLDEVVNYEPSEWKTAIYE